MEKSREEIEMNKRDKLIELINRCNDINVNSKIADNTDLIEDLGYSSLNLMELIVEIEMEFNIEIEDEFLNIELLTKFDKLLEIVQMVIDKEGE